MKKLPEASYNSVAELFEDSIEKTVEMVNVKEFKDFLIKHKLKLVSTQRQLENGTLEMVVKGAKLQRHYDKLVKPGFAIYTNGYIRRIQSSGLSPIKKFPALLNIEDFKILLNWFDNFLDRREVAKKKAKLKNEVFKKLFKKLEPELVHIKKDFSKKDTVTFRGQDFSNIELYIHRNPLKSSKSKLDSTQFSITILKIGKKEKLYCNFSSPRHDSRLHGIFTMTTSTFVQDVKRIISQMDMVFESMNQEAKHLETIARKKFAKKISKKEFIGFEINDLARKYGYSTHVAFLTDKRIGVPFSEP